MARYMLTGIDDQKWRQFKAACNLRGCTVKQSIIDHIEIIIAGFGNQVKQDLHNYHKKPEGKANDTDQS